MINRLAVVSAACVLGTGVFIAHPWFIDHGNSYYAQQAVIALFSVVASGMVYVSLRALGWVITGE